MVSGETIVAIVEIGASIIGSALAIRYSFASRLRRTKHYRIADLPENKRGRIVGTVQPHEGTLVAPFSQRPCVYYEASVFRPDPEARTYAKESIGIPFILDDNTGTAVIDPRNGRVQIYVDVLLDFGRVSRANVGALLARCRVNPALAEWPLLRYMEARIEIGEQLAVVGSGIRDSMSHGDEGYRDTKASRILMGASRRSTLWIRKV